ncbi:MAG: RidA family protein [Candidatus Poribacteria bacterium]|nr:RidA family protein [Candidatus Poribacteria bacterium]
MQREIIFTDKASPPGGAYSQAVKVGQLVFTAGMAAIDPKTKKLIAPGDIGAQTSKTLDNLQAALEAAGTSLENAIKVNAYIHDIDEWGKFNEAYIKYFPKDPPVRTTIAVGGFSEGMCVEIDVIALIPD